MCKVYTGYDDTSEIEHGCAPVRLIILSLKRMVCAPVRLIILILSLKRMPVCAPVRFVRLRMPVCAPVRLKRGDYQPYRRTNHALSLT